MNLENLLKLFSKKNLVPNLGAILNWIKSFCGFCWIKNLPVIWEVLACLKTLNKCATPYRSVCTIFRTLPWICLSNEYGIMICIIIHSNWQSLNHWSQQIIILKNLSLKQCSIKLTTIDSMWEIWKWNAPPSNRLLLGYIRWYSTHYLWKNIGLSLCCYIGWCCSRYGQAFILWQWQKLLNSLKVTVQAGVAKFGIIEPYFFIKTVDIACYFDITEGSLVPEFEKKKRKKYQVWFQLNSTIRATLWNLHWDLTAKWLTSGGFFIKLK